MDTEHGFILAFQRRSLKRRSSPVGCRPGRDPVVLEATICGIVLAAVANVLEHAQRGTSESRSGSKTGCSSPKSKTTASGSHRTHENRSASARSRRQDRARQPGRGRNAAAGRGSARRSATQSRLHTGRGQAARARARRLRPPFGRSRAGRRNREPLLPRTIRCVEGDPRCALLRLVSGYRVSQALHVAARLGIADRLAAGARSSDDLAAETETHADALYRLLVCSCGDWRSG